MRGGSRAAETLYLTQPTVSEHIRTLEDEVGVRLLDRLGRGAAVTRAGQLLRGEYLRGLLAAMVLAMSVKLAYDLIATPLDLFSISIAR